MESCTHPEELCIEDHHEGTVVCTGCSRVLDQLYAFEANISYPRNEEQAPKAYTFISISAEDICANFNLPSSILPRCGVIFDEARKSLKWHKFPLATLSAYALYKSMTEEGIVRSPQEIQCMMGVTLSQIYEVEKVMQRNTINITTSEDYLERFVVQCGLNFNDFKVIRKKCQIAEEICENFAPQTIAAALVFLYHKSLTVRKVSEICLVSASSIHKIVTKLTNDLRFHQV